MQARKHLIVVAAIISCLFGASNAFSEECNKVCRYEHIMYSGYVFAYRHYACEPADCYPVPPHNHPPTGNWGIKAIDTNDGGLAAESLSGFNLSPTAESGEQTDHGDKPRQPDDQAHGHTHDHTDLALGHSHDVVPAGMDHHHGERLEDQPMVFVDESTGEILFFSPKAPERESKDDNSSNRLGPIDWMELQSAHIVGFCDPSTGECDTY